MNTANPTTNTRTFIHGLLVGAVLGTMVMGLLFWVANRAAKRKQGDNFLPVIVAAQDIAPGTVLTLEMLQQRLVFSPQPVSSSVIHPDFANQVIGARTLFPLKAEDELTWTGVSVGITSDQCRQACEWVEAAGSKKAICGFDDRLGAMNCEWVETDKGPKQRVEAGL